MRTCGWMRCWEHHIMEYDCSYSGSLQMDHPPVIGKLVPTLKCTSTTHMESNGTELAQTTPLHRLNYRMGRNWHSDGRRSCLLVTMLGVGTGYYKVCLNSAWLPGDRATETDRTNMHTYRIFIRSFWSDVLCTLYALYIMQSRWQ